MAGVNSEKAIRWIAKKASEDPFFIGWALSKYRNIHQIDDKELSGRLVCPPEALDKLALCRLPNDTSEAFQEHVKQIADYVSCNANQLLKILREVSAIITMREVSQTDGDIQYLLAARDRKSGDDGSSGKSGE